MSVEELLEILKHIDREMSVIITTVDGKEPEIEAVKIKKDKAAGIICAELVYNKTS